ncbi:MAG: EthD family reductase, partial [Bacteroidota bacterium]
TFQQYQLEVHIPLVHKIPDLRYYEVDLVPPGSETSPYDVMGALWFDSETIFQNAMSSSEAQKAIADQANFLEGSAVILPVLEHNFSEA